MFWLALKIHYYNDNVFYKFQKGTIGLKTSGIFT